MKQKFFLLLIILFGTHTGLRADNKKQNMPDICIQEKSQQKQLKAYALAIYKRAHKIIHSTKTKKKSVLAKRVAHDKRIKRILKTATEKNNFNVKDIYAKARELAQEEHDKITELVLYFLSKKSVREWIKEHPIASVGIFAGLTGMSLWGGKCLLTFDYKSLWTSFMQPATASKTQEKNTEIEMNTIKEKTVEEEKDNSDSSIVNHETNQSLDESNVLPQHTESDLDDERLQDSQEQLHDNHKIIKTKVSVPDATVQESAGLSDEEQSEGEDTASDSETGAFVMLEQVKVIAHQMSDNIDKLKTDLQHEVDNIDKNTEEYATAMKTDAWDTAQEDDKSEMSCEEGHSSLSEVVFNDDDQISDAKEFFKKKKKKKILEEIPEIKELLDIEVEGPLEQLAGMQLLRKKAKKKQMPVWEIRKEEWKNGEVTPLIPSNETELLTSEKTESGKQEKKSSSLKSEKKKNK